MSEHPRNRQSTKGPGSREGDSRTSFDPGDGPRSLEELRRMFGVPSTKSDTSARRQDVARRGRAAFRRLAALHAELARACEDLAEVAGIGLAEWERTSLTRSTPMRATHPVPPDADVASPSDLINQAELAQLLQCNPRTVRRMELEGRLPQASGKGRLKRWRRADIEKWIEGKAPSCRRGSR